MVETYKKVVLLCEYITWAENLDTAINDAQAQLNFVVKDEQGNTDLELTQQVTAQLEQESNISNELDRARQSRENTLKTFNIHTAGKPFWPISMRNMTNEKLVTLKESKERAKKAVVEEYRCRVNEAIEQASEAVREAKRLSFEGTDLQATNENNLKAIQIAGRQLTIVVPQKKLEIERAKKTLQRAQTCLGLTDLDLTFTPFDQTPFHEASSLLNIAKQSLLKKLRTEIEDAFLATDSAIKNANKYITDLFTPLDPGSLKGQPITIVLINEVREAINTAYAEKNQHAIEVVETQYVKHALDMKGTLFIAIEALRTAKETLNIVEEEKRRPPLPELKRDEVTAIKNRREALLSAGQALAQKLDNKVGHSANLQGMIKKLQESCDEYLDLADEEEANLKHELGELEENEGNREKREALASRMVLHKQKRERFRSILRSASREQ